MSAKTYLEKILARQTLKADGQEMKALNEEKIRVENLIQKEFKDSNPTIKIAGSIAKGSALKDSYDLDICVYFPREDSDDCGETLKEIYEKAKACLEKEYYVVIKPVALRLQSNSPNTKGVDCHIDVVPGRFVDGTEGDCYLHITTGDKNYFKTNLKVHLNHIKNSGLIDQIKLLKLWRNRSGLSVRTFILELLVIKILKGSKATSLQEYLIEFWMGLRDNIDNVTIEDPANPYGNDLSEIFDENIKSQLQSAAHRTLQLVDLDRWEDIYGPVEDRDTANRVASVVSVASTYRTPPRPYCDDVV